MEIILKMATNTTIKKTAEKKIPAVKALAKKSASSPQTNSDGHSFKHPKTSF